MTAFSHSLICTAGVCINTILYRVVPINTAHEISNEVEQNGWIYPGEIQLIYYKMGYTFGFHSAFGPVKSKFKSYFAGYDLHLQMECFLKALMLFDSYPLTMEYRTCISHLYAPLHKCNTRGIKMVYQWRCESEVGLQYQEAEVDAIYPINV